MPAGLIILLAITTALIARSVSIPLQLNLLNRHDTNRTANQVEQSFPLEVSDRYAKLLPHCKQIMACSLILSAVLFMCPPAPILPPLAAARPGQVRPPSDAMAIMGVA